MVGGEWGTDFLNPSFLTIPSTLPHSPIKDIQEKIILDRGIL